MENLTKKKRGLLDKIFKREPYYNLYVDIYNYLIPEDIKEIDFEKIEEITSQYPSDYIKKNKKLLLSLLNEKLSQFYSDHELDENEINFIKTYIQLFSVNTADVDDYQNKLSIKSYSEILESFIDDDYLSDEEKRRLENVSNNLKLTSKELDIIHEEKLTPIIDRNLKKITEDERISPEEEQFFSKICENLGIKPEFDKKDRTILERYKAFWKIEHQGLEEINVNINLQKNESCYLHLNNIEWYETRKVTDRINYGGPTVRFKIMKGVYYRAGSMKVRPVSYDVLSLIDIGDVYLTSKRLIFMGEKGNKNIPYNKILDLGLYSDGFSIEKDSGKSPTLKINGDIQLIIFIFSYLLSR